MAEVEGQGMADLRGKWTVQGATKSNGEAAPDPFRQALADKRQLLAARVMDATVRNTEVESIQAENQKLNALIEQQKLREAVAGGGDTEKQQAWQEYIMGELKGLRDQLAAEQAERHAATVNALQERLGMLSQELERQRERQAEPVDQLGQAMTTLQTAKSLMETMYPPRPEPAPALPTGEDAGLRKWLAALDAQREHERMEREERREERQEELRLKREIAQAELDLKTKESETRNRFFETTAPKITDIAGRIFVMLIEGRQTVAVPTAAPAGAAAPMAAADVSPVAPAISDPSVHSLTCQCGQQLYYREEWPGVICARCGAEYNNPAAAPPAGGESASGHDAAGYQGGQPSTPELDSEGSHVTPGVY